MKISQSVFAPPPMSRRRKMSPMILNKSMNHATQTKNTSIDQSTPKNG